MTDKGAFKILVVDDETDLEILMKQNFRRRIRANELEFIFAHNGKEALQLLKLHPDVDVMFSDINMPEMDGLTLLNHVLRDYQMIRSIVISAYGDMKNVRMAMNNGAFDFINKPIDFADLEATLQKTLNAVIALREAEKNKVQLHAVQRELEIGKQIQKSFLPTHIPEIPGYDLAAFFQPAKEVAGDFYDVFHLAKQKKLGFALGDVCGKGVGSALFMTLVRSLINAFSKINFEYEHGALKTIQMAHDYILENHEEASMFATVFYGIIDLEKKVLHYINCGHNAPYLVNGKNELIELAPSGPVLGMFPSNDFREKTIQLEDEFKLFVFTDGCTDIVNKDNIAYGEERLLARVKELIQLSSGELLKTLADELLAYSDGVDQFDDITMLAIRSKEF